MVVSESMFLSSPLPPSLPQPYIVSSNTDSITFLFLRSAQKFIACLEHLLLENLLPTVRRQRVSVPVQLDDVSCGWRTALNAHLLMKKIFNIPDVSDVITCISII